MNILHFGPNVVDIKLPSNMASGYYAPIFIAAFAVYIRARGQKVIKDSANGSLLVAFLRGAGNCRVASRSDCLVVRSPIPT